MGFLDRAIRRGVSSAVSSAVEKAVGSQIQDGVDRRVQAGAQAIESNMRTVAKGMGVRFCTECGTPLEAGEKFCSNCGTPAAAQTAGQPAQTQQAQQAQQTPQAQQLPPSQMPTHFRSILAEEFAGYTVREGLSAQDIGLAADGPARPYSFCLYKAGLKCAIMLTDHNRDNNRAFRSARAACEQAGIPFLNFYTHFPNERSYVVNRIQSAL